MVTSYINVLLPHADSSILKQKLVEHTTRKGVMFDVPNPESDIDKERTAEDGEAAFRLFRKLRDDRILSL